MLKNFKIVPIPPNSFVGFDNDLNLNINLLLRSRVIDDENEAVSRSIYVRHMRKWLDEFKPNQIHVVSGEQVMGLLRCSGGLI